MRSGPRAELGLWDRARRLDQPELVLTAVRPPRLAAGVDEEVLFLRHADRLVRPLGDGRRHLQLARVPHARDDLVIAPSRDALLVVPEPDQGAGAMAVDPDRVTVHRAVEPFALHALEHRGEDLIAGATRLRLLEEKI